ncbi:MAG: sugar phosphate isomerase/epimerase [Actinobacteria bacterium]|nr:sugar phosphate isomerase/epimerase [Actinomycetota bacterium]
MKLGFVSAILPEYSFEEIVDFAAEIGMKCVEIMCWPKGKAERRYAGVTHIDAEELNKDKVDKINEYLKKKGVIISALGYYPNPLDSDLMQRKVYIDHIKKCIKAANILGLSNFNTFIGKDPLKPVKDNMEEFKKVWPEIVKYAEDFNVKIGIENCPMYFKDEWPGGKNLAASPQIWRDMFSIIDSKNFGLNYDPSHFIWQMMDYIKPIYEFKDKIFHFHIKDAKFYADRYNDVGIFAAPLDYHTPKLPGLGDINWGTVVSALMDINYKGCAVIEVEDRVFEDTLNDRLNAVILSGKYMQQYII